MARKEDRNNVAQMSILTAELEEAVTTARQRLMKFDKYVRVDETRTRMFIIDEILNGLGWRVLDPQLVLLEHREEREHDGLRSSGRREETLGCGRSQEISRSR